ncbi:MAG TPA: metallophosphoesterase, partial [Spirochaetota bacterium]
STYLWDHFDRNRFGDVNLIISTGDLSADYLDFLVSMINVPLLYVPGNHDESYLTHEPAGCDNIDGKLVTVGGIRILGFGGSQRYKTGPFQHTESEMKRKAFFMKPRIWKNDGFDILVTHSPAYNLGDGKDDCHTGFKAFNQLLDKYQPKYFLHGHQHLSYGGQNRIITYHDTSIINTEGYYLFDF